MAGDRMPHGRIPPLDRLGESLREAAELDIANRALNRAIRRARLSGLICMTVGIVMGFVLPHSAIPLVTCLVTLWLFSLALWRWL